MPFRGGGAKTYKTRIPLPNGRSVIRSTGTTSKSTANAVAGFVRQLKATRDREALAAIAEKRVTLANAFDAHVRQTLPELLASANDPDLSPLVDEWAGGGTPRYIPQLRRFIPAGSRFPLSKFRRSEISRWLAELTDAQSGGTDEEGDEIPPRPVSASTRNRYRAALSMFARWLVEREVLATNVVRDVSAAKIPRRRLTFLEPAQVKQLVNALPTPYRAFEALLAGTGMEYSATVGLRRRDIDTDRRMVFAQGSKTSYRTRYVEVTEDWAWRIVEAHIKALAPAALLFPEITPSKGLARHADATTAQGLPRTVLHQHRHSFAVMHLKRGCDHQWLKNQLGHAPQSTLIYSVYGTYIGAQKLTAAQRDRMPNPEKSATNRATTARVISRRA